MIRKICATLMIITTVTLLPAYAEEHTLTTIGTVRASATSRIGSQVGGRVAEVMVDAGDHVRKGEPLVKLDATYFQIDLQQREASLEAAKIELVDAEKNYSRMKKLWEKPEGEIPSISLKRFEESKNRYDQAVVRVKEAEALLNRMQANLNESVIKAPFEGYVTDRYVDVGDMVAPAPATAVVEMRATNPLYLEFSVPQAYLASIRPGTALEFEIEGSNLEGSNKGRYKGQIDLVYPSIDEATRTVKCRAILNDMPIMPGSLASITLKIKS